MNPKRAERGFTIISSLHTATIQPAFCVRDLEQLPANLRCVQVSGSLAAHQFKLLAEYLRRSSQTELRLFSMLSSKTRFDNLWPLSHFTTLKRLALELVHLQSLERVAPLAESLESFTLGPTRNRKLDLSWLSQASQLRSLNVDGQTGVSSVLSDLPQLLTLRVANLNLSQLENLNVSSRLENVELNSCSFQSLHWLSRLKKLDSLKLEKIVCLAEESPIQNLPRCLKALWISDLELSDPEELARLKALEMLKLARLKSRLNLTSLVKLKRLTQLVLEKICIAPLESQIVRTLARLDRFVLDDATRKTLGVRPSEFASQFPSAEVSRHPGLVNWRRADN